MAVRVKDFTGELLKGTKEENYSRVLSKLLTQITNTEEGIRCAQVLSNVAEEGLSTNVLDNAYDSLQEAEKYISDSLVEVNTVVISEQYEEDAENNE